MKKSPLQNTNQMSPPPPPPPHSQRRTHSPPGLMVFAQFEYMSAFLTQNLDPFSFWQEICHFVYYVISPAWMGLLLTLSEKVEKRN